MIYDEHPEVEGGTYADSYPDPNRTSILGRVQDRLYKVRWLSAMVYRVIADPNDEDGISRNLLKATFIEERPYVIDSIVDALIDVGIVEQVGTNLKAVPYADED